MKIQTKTWYKYQKHNNKNIFYEKLTKLTLLSATTKPLKT